MHLRNAIAALCLSTTFATAGAAVPLQIVADAADGFPGLVFDAGQGLLWLQDTNWAWNSGELGRMITWNEATAWADNLVVTHDGRVYADWRLPTVAEMAYLRSNYQSAGLPIGTGYTTLPEPVTSPGPFLVNQFIDGATADAWAWDEVSSGAARYMDMDAVFSENGYTAGKDTAMLTWGAVMVPEPESWLMVGAGLLLVAGFSAQRRSR